MNESYDFSDIPSEDDLHGYDYPKEGTYHVAVNSADDSREKVDGIKVALGVLAGTVEGQRGKPVTETFWDPNPEHKDGGKFALKRIGKFLLATGVMTQKQLGKPDVKIDWQATVGRQLVVGVINYERKDEESGKVYRGANIDGLHIYRVNAAEVAEVPKDQAALALLGQAATQAPASAAPTPTPSRQVSPDLPPEQQAVPAVAGGNNPNDWSKI